MPAAAAFMAGICRSVNVDHEIIDLNAELRSRIGAENWQKLAAETDIKTNYQFRLEGPASHAALDEFFKETCNLIRDQEFDAVAISVLTFMQHPWTELFLENLKRICPDVITILGGPGMGSTYKIEDSVKISFGRYLVNKELADYFVLGEGDILFRKFLLGEAHGLPGFNSKHTEDSWQPQIDDLDQTPLPNYEKFKFENYAFYLDKPEITLTASRGCVRRCTFCDIGHHWKKFRFRSGSRVVDEMYKGYADMGVTKFWFNDSLMNGSYKQFFDFLECLQKKQSQDPGFSKITYGGQLILRNQTHHSAKMYELLGSTGGNFFQVGVESGSERVRDHMLKKFSNSDIYYHYEMCERFGIQNWIFLLVGYPTETDQDFQDTLDMLTNLQRYLINDTIVGVSFTSMDVLENTPLATMMSELDIEYLHDENNKIIEGAWTSPSMDPQKKYLRWIKLAKHVLNLGYRTHRELQAYIKRRQYALDQPDHLQTKRVIPIGQILS